MKRKKILIALAAVATTASILTSCVQSEQKTTTNISTTNIEDGVIVHNVYFWLKEGITEEERKDFLKFFEVLKKLPGIQTFQVGTPAKTNPRPVVDNSFSYNIIVTFKNLEDIGLYENHPDHLAGADKYKKYWTKVEVKDTSIGL